MYNKNIVRLIADINRTCQDPARWQQEINNVMAKYGARTELIKSLPNGINHYRILDQNGLEIGDYHAPEPIKQWGGYRPGAGRPSTGRKRHFIYVTDDEFEKVQQFITQLREPS